MVDISSEWSDELPSEEGEYLIRDSSGKKRKVHIENIKLDNNPERPDNFHVFENGDYCSLSIENGCNNWLWTKI